jgi:hypothetical protein
MKAYKFLAPGAVGPFSGFRWPTPAASGPGPWVDGTADELARCRAAVHACRVDDLPWWIQPELWEVELAEPVRRTRHKLFAPRGRLVARCRGWDAEAAHAFGRACAARAAGHAAGALEAVGQPDAAAALRAAQQPEEIEATARRLRVPEPVRVVVTMAGDAGTRARGGHASTAAYIAAHAAYRAGGDDAMAAERARQAAWLADRVGLTT